MGWRLLRKIWNPLENYKPGSGQNGRTLVRFSESNAEGGQSGQEKIRLFVQILGRIVFPQYIEYRVGHYWPAFFLEE